MKFGVLKFPGSNCDQDAFYAIQDVLGQPVQYLWHQDHGLHNVDCVVVPGGFSYGDYLRCGAIARFAPIMAATQDFAARGGLVLGICNGFQVLCESHLLPGALVRNGGQQFVCKQIYLRTETNQTPFTNAMSWNQVLQVPVAHGEGNYVCDDDTLDELQSQGRVVFRYCEADGQDTPQSNPNESRDNIAGIINAQGNVLGMMPHPERATDPRLGSGDGRLIFESLLRCAVSALG